MKEYGSNWSDWCDCDDHSKHWSRRLYYAVASDNFKFCIRPHTPGFVNDGESGYPAYGFDSMDELEQVPYTAGKKIEVKSYHDNESLISVDGWVVAYLAILTGV